MIRDSLDESLIKVRLTNWQGSIWIGSIIKFKLNFKLWKGWGVWKEFSKLKLRLRLNVRTSNLEARGESVSRVRWSRRFRATVTISSVSSWKVEILKSGLDGELRRQTTSSVHGIDFVNRVQVRLVALVYRWCGEAAQRTYRRALVDDKFSKEFQSYRIVCVLSARRCSSIRIECLSRAEQCSLFQFGFKQFKWSLISIGDYLPEYGRLTCFDCRMGVRLATAADKAT